MKIEKEIKSNKKKEKNVNMFLIFMKYLVLFILFDILISNVPSYVGRYIVNGRYINYFVVESIAVILSIIAMVLAGNSYVFKEKKNDFLSSLLVGGFPIFISLVNFIPSIGPAVKNSLPNVVSLAFYCAAIGLFEEFMCRGWIQTEFIERNSKTFKQVCVSILLSSLIFGGMHITNIWLGGQTVLQTVTQIIQAVGMGFLLGAIFFRTRNIWSVAFIHAFWDFALLLEESTQIKACTYGTPTNSILIFQFVSSTILSIIYVIVALYILRKTRTTEYFTNIETDTKKDDNFFSSLILVAIVLWIVLANNTAKVNYDDYKTCYSYETIAFENYETVYPHVNDYRIESEYEKSLGDIELPTKAFNGVEDEEIILAIEEKTIYKLSLSIKEKDNKLYFVDNTTEKEYELPFENVFDYEILNNDNTYEIIIVSRDPKSGESKVYMSNYINFDNLSKDERIETIIKSFKEYNNMPVIYRIGYIVDLNDNYKYPLFDSNADSVIINKEESVLQLKK